MGERAFEMSRQEAEQRVIRLRSAIAEKRDAIGIELDELRRRREYALVRAKQGAQVGGMVLLGGIVFGSLLNAVMDLFRDEDDENKGHVSVGAVAGTPVLLSIIYGIGRAAANDMVRREVGKWLDARMARHRNLPAPKENSTALIAKSQETRLIVPDQETRLVSENKIDKLPLTEEQHNGHIFK
jgi:hypothetical protein